MYKQTALHWTGLNRCFSHTVLVNLCCAVIHPFSRLAMKVQHQLKGLRITRRWVGWLESTTSLSPTDSRLHADSTLSTCHSRPLPRLRRVTNLLLLAGRMVTFRRGCAVRVWLVAADNAAVAAVRGGVCAKWLVARGHRGTGWLLFLFHF